MFDEDERRRDERDAFDKEKRGEDQKPSPRGRIETK
jgi:hypothetical protein